MKLLIELPVDEAYAFDHLAILCVKCEHGIGDPVYYGRVLTSITSALGNALFFEALASDEFDALLRANREIWDLVDKAARDECPASAVDQANQRRYEAKRALQNRFWPQQPLTESKAVRSGIIGGSVRLRARAKARLPRRSR